MHGCAPSCSQNKILLPSNNKGACPALPCAAHGRSDLLKMQGRTMQAKKNFWGPEIYFSRSSFDISRQLRSPTACPGWPALPCPWSSTHCPRLVRFVENARLSNASANNTFGAPNFFYIRLSTSPVGQSLMSLREGSCKRHCSASRPKQARGSLLWF